MNARREYLEDLLQDCYEAVEGKVPEEQKPVVVAALILSDSLNGLRKAMLQSASRRGGPAHD